VIRLFPSLKTPAILAATVLAVAAFSFCDGLKSQEFPTAPEFKGPFPISWVPDQVDPNRVLVVVSGIGAPMLGQIRNSNWEEEKWQQLLSVRAGDRNLPAMIGSHGIGTKPGEIWFRPQFPLDPRIKYYAVFNPRILGGPVRVDSFSSTFQLPTPSSDPVTVISQVYPTATVIPENLLKLYLYFSAPMSRGHIYDYVHLRDDQGRNVELPFLEIGEELWDPSMTRLTLFIDPGRIKRGVKPLEEVGPSLTAGRRYTFVIDPAWQDANGLPLKSGFSRTYQVIPPDREPLDPEHWTITTPKSGTHESIGISFPKPMDHALAERVIQITDSTGQLIEGKTVLQTGDCQWSFVPDQAWKTQAYRAVIQLTLEDLAGNNIGKPFEVDLFKGVQPRLTGSSVKLGFELK
jgi:hypothetical protein